MTSKCQYIQIGKSCCVKESTMFVLGVEGGDGEDTVFYFEVGSVGSSGVFGMGENHGNKFYRRVISCQLKVINHEHVNTPLDQTLVTRNIANKS
eukprot:9047247-Ditylum_brightwellii.AAC.1